MVEKISFPLAAGFPDPLGITSLEKGINFSLYTSSAKEVSLLLFQGTHTKPCFTIALDPVQNKTGSIWHILIENPLKNYSYAYLIDGKGPFSDPYAKALDTHHKWMDLAHPYQPLGCIDFPPPFDWQNVSSPNIPFQELIIYEMHVRGFTQDPSSGTHHRGTFTAFIEKIPYLKSLGINAVQLLPIFEFNEKEYDKSSLITKERLCNFWGYSTVNFFTVMKRFGTSSENFSALNEFKTLIRELHRNGIEVILDVVYNHTAEGGEKGPSYSFKGIDKKTYYLFSDKGEYLNFSGCGNSIRANYTPVSDLILDSLKYFALECQVDGFRFDLASALTRGDKGTPLSDPPLIRRIAEDPILSQKKLIAEAWDAAGLYQVGHFPSYGVFAEWNGVYRDIVRRFIKGTDNVLGTFADLICGSKRLYTSHGKPYHSINFITAHDGFCLHDLVSYQNKHNTANGENNADGANSNDSWNYGKEGETEDKAILMLRSKQMKNFMIALLLSQGTPMLLMGDEVEQSRNGNNNTWCQDNELNWFCWDLVKDKALFLHFVSKLISLRKTIPHLNSGKFFTPQDISWHGTHPNAPDWGIHSRFIAYTLGDYYIAFNMYYNDLVLTLPSPASGKAWHLLVDSSQEGGEDFLETPLKISSSNHSIESHSTLILQAL